MSTLARDRDLSLRDEAARALARSSFEEPLLLEAGAGTGKTTTLIARLVAWTLGPGWERAGAERPSAEHTEIARAVLDGVVAITFTEAAAADMEGKLAAAYVDLARGTTPRGVTADDLPRDRDACAGRARALARALDRPVVHTIHAFCRGLLADHPFEAGVPPNFDVDADGSAVDRIAHDVLEEELAARLAEKPDEVLARLLTRDVGPKRLHEALSKLAADGRRASELDSDPYEPERSTELVVSLSAALNAFLDGPAAVLKRVSAQAKVTHAVLADLAAVRDALPTERPVSIESLDSAADSVREHWPKASRDRLADWAAGTFNTTETKCAKEHAPTIAAQAAAIACSLDVFRRMRPLLHDSARTSLARWLERVTSELRARAILTYADLLHDARDLVRDHPRIVAGLRSRMRQLVVDEFQDTDPVQCEIIRRIALDDVPGTRKPGLFLVGDPKQSIYGWRSADLEAYEHFASELVTKHGGRRERLSVNHRSTRRILAEVERVMAPIMLARAGVQPQFEPLVPSRDCDGAPVEHVVPWCVDESADGVPGPASKTKAREIEADWIAADLAVQHANGTCWRDMAVLLRATGDLETYLAALRAHGVPYEVAGDKSYFQRREIIEASVLVRTIVDPRDHVALVALLRSSFVGVPDAALIPLWRHGFHEHATEIAKPGDGAHAAALRAVEGALPEVPHDVPGIERVADFGASLAAAVHAIARLRESLAGDPSDVFVEAMRTLFLAEAKAAWLYLGPYRVSNLERFFDRLAAELDEAGTGTQSCLRALRAAVNERREAEDARPKDAALDAVQVLTIHKSKGLDFAHVYVADMDRDTPPARLSNCDLACVLGRTSYVFFGSATPGYEDVEAARERVAAAERVRTLYVAMTRARERLVLCLPLPEAIAPVSWEDSDTHLDLLLASTAVDAPATIRAAHARGARSIAIGDGAWILPEAPRSPAARSRRDELDDGAFEIPRGIVELPKLRARAVERMRRAWSGAASAGAEHDRADRPGTAGAGRDEATALGRAFHRVLESATDQDAPATLHTALARALERELDRTPSPALRERAKALVDGFTAGSLHRKLASLQKHVIARELPVLSPPAADDEALAFISGAIDLVYRDPDTGEIVIADYKTDLAPSDTAGARYAAQGGAYQRAVRDALGLERDPRFELWYVAQDRIEVVA